MNFKLKSLKVKDEEGISVTVQTQNGVTITTTLQAKDIPGLETLEIDVSREVKMELRKELKQLELKDESETH